MHARAAVVTENDVRAALDQLGRQQVRRSRLVTPGGDAGQGFRVPVGRLPGQAGQRGAEPDRVLSGAAGDFQDQRPGRQQVAQHGQDGFSVPRGGGGGSGGRHPGEDPSMTVGGAWEAPPN